MIEDYSFGRIVVDGRAYTNDIKIIGGKVLPEWWRREGHRLHLEDMQDALESHPRIIVVGCGHDGVMRVMPEVRERCSSLGIELIELRTADAVKRYNGLEGPGVVGLFHLTC
jgi:hypothetical protein